MIQTEPGREALIRNCLVEHAAQCDSVDRARLQAKPNNGAGELIHHDQDPMRPQMDGFNLNQVHAPQAVFGPTQQAEPRRTITADIGAVMHRQHSSDQVFVDLDRKGIAQLLRNPRTTKAGVAPLEFHDGADQFG